MILELRDKLAGLSLEFTPTEDSVPHNGLFDDALSALLNLGYKKNDAEQTLKKVYAKEEKDSSLESLIKECLNLLS
jgi:Holliday junction DNA helicase RuvA